MDEVEWEGVPCGHKFKMMLDLSDGSGLIAMLERGIECPACKPGAT
jgi:hypothetical protein